VIWFTEGGLTSMEFPSCIFIGPGAYAAGTAKLNGHQSQI